MKRLDAFLITFSGLFTVPMTAWAFIAWEIPPVCAGTRAWFVFALIISCAQAWAADEPPSLRYRGRETGK